MSLLNLAQITKLLSQREATQASVHNGLDLSKNDAQTYDVDGLPIIERIWASLLDNPSVGTVFIHRRAFIHLANDKRTHFKDAHRNVILFLGPNGDVEVHWKGNE